MTTTKMRRCFNCGAQIEDSAYYDPLDTCGSRECDRAARDTALEQREQAHDDLDRDMGW